MHKSYKNNADSLCWEHHLFFSGPDAEISLNLKQVNLQIQSQSQCERDWYPNMRGMFCAGTQNPRQQNSHGVGLTVKISYVASLTFKVEISEFRLSHVNAHFTYLLKLCGIYMILGSLEANNMHFKTHFFVYKQDKRAFFITFCYIVLIFL